MNTSRANGGNNYTWRGANGQRRCDHNSRVVCCLVLGQLNDLVISSTSHLCPPVNYQSRCSSRNVVACSVRNRIVTMETEPPLLPFLFFLLPFSFSRSSIRTSRICCIKTHINHGRMTWTVLLESLTIFFIFSVR